MTRQHPIAVACYCGWRGRRVWKPCECDSEYGQCGCAYGECPRCKARVWSTEEIRRTREQDARTTDWWESKGKWMWGDERMEQHADAGVIVVAARLRDATRPLPPHVANQLVGIVRQYHRTHGVRGEDHDDTDRSDGTGGVHGGVAL